MHKSPYIAVILLVLLLNGCQHGVWGKRQSELCCPTDIRKTHKWSFGEDALFCYPCGPDHACYGHKETSWRDWPTSMTGWQDTPCEHCIEGSEFQPPIEMGPQRTPAPEQDQPHVPSPETHTPSPEPLIPSPESVESTPAVSQMGYWPPQTDDSANTPPLPPLPPFPGS